MKCWLPVLLAACGPAIPPLPAQGGPPWLELTSEHFTLWTDTPVDRARELVGEMEHLRQVVIGTSFRSVARDGRVFVIGLRDEDELHVYYPEQFLAIASPADGNALHQPMIVLAASTRAGGEDHIEAHELTHVISYGMIARQPRWFAEGLASFFETIQIDERRGTVDLGRPHERRGRPMQLQPAGVRTQKEEVDDAAHAAIALVKATPGIDARRIVLLGHSQGGYLAPRIARADPAIRGLVILAGSTRPLEDSILAQLKYLAALTPADPQLSSLIGDAEKFKQAVESPALKPDDSLTSPISGDIPGAYFLEVRDYHPEKVAASLAIPIAILQGERDYQVTVADDFAAWKAALGKRKNVAFYTYPDANHAFVGGTGPSTPAEYSRPGHVEDKVIDDLATWIAALRK